jgi:glycosyltransferase involved in cell wall biosynthesis
VIVALFNAEAFVEECLDSVVAQTYGGAIELVVHDDASTDSSAAVFAVWVDRTSAARRARRPFPVTVVAGASARNGGAGAARNAAVRASSGSVLCIQDADDVMFPGRISAQVAALLEAQEQFNGTSAPSAGPIMGEVPVGSQCGAEVTARAGSSGAVITTAAAAAATLHAAATAPAAPPTAATSPAPPAHHSSLVIVGSQFERIPLDATRHYAAWANALTAPEAAAQRFRECTLVHPTWCYGRATFDTVGGYPEVSAGKGRRDSSFSLSFSCSRCWCGACVALF